MTDHERARCTVMILIHAQQTKNWLEFAMSNKMMRLSAKQRATNLIQMISNFLSEIEKQTGEKDFLFEESAEISDMVGRFLNYTPDDCKRILGLMDKIDREKEAKLQSL